MCNPAMAVGAAMMAGSLVANNQAQHKVDKARAGAREAESIRQGMFDNENTALNEQSQDRYKDYEGKQNDTAQSLASFYGDNKSPSDAPSAIPVNSSGNVTINREMAKKSSEASAYGDQQDYALSNLRSFGDLLGTIGRGQARDASQISQINGFKQGSANILPYELEAANGKGNSLRTLGAILQAGGAAMMGGGMGGLAAGGAGATSGMGAGGVSTMGTVGGTSAAGLGSLGAGGYGTAVGSATAGMGTGGLGALSPYLARGAAALPSFGTTQKQRR
jgi:hypothetical protein